MTIIEERLTPDITLKHGMHDPASGEMCLLEAVAHIAGEEWSDHPECVCPVLGAFGRAWNDGLPDDETRTRLLAPFIPRLVGTRHELMPHLTVMVYPEQIEHLEHLLGSPVIKIALNYDDNVVFDRTPESRGGVMRAEGIYQCEGCGRTYPEYVNGCVEEHPPPRKVVLAIAEGKARSDTPTSRLLDAIGLHGHAEYERRRTTLPPPRPLDRTPKGDS